MKANTIFNTDCRDGLKLLPDNSVNCRVTSPPYYGLRDYGVDNQIGLEESPEEYVRVMVSIFQEVYRVLTPDGTLWLNIGDSYWGGKGYSGSSAFGGKGTIRPTDRKHPVIKRKDMIGIPWMLAFALRDAGWYLRQDIIWHKPNPMPESVKDRCTKAHEYIFLLTKSAKYWFDPVREPQSINTHLRFSKDVESGLDSVPEARQNSKECNRPGYVNYRKYTPKTFLENGRNKRDVWTVCARPEKESHFAVFPEKLIADCIKAGCPEGGVVLDPFMGSGTTAAVARKLNRNYIGFELNPDYIRIANRKLNRELGIFK